MSYVTPPQIQLVMKKIFKFFMTFDFAPHNPIFKVDERSQIVVPT